MLTSDLKNITEKLTEKKKTYELFFERSHKSAPQKTRFSGSTVTVFGAFFRSEICKSNILNFMIPISIQNPRQKAEHKNVFSILALYILVPIKECVNELDSQK